MCYALVVDDDKEICRLISHMFDTYKIDTAATIEKAEEMVNQVRPDIIILDLMLGDGDGHEFLKRNVINSAVIVITGQEVTEDLEVSLLEDGATMVLQKPVNLRKLKLITDRVAGLMNVDTIIKSSTARLIEATKELKKIKSGILSSGEVPKIQ